MKIEEGIKWDDEMSSASIAPTVLFDDIQRSDKSYCEKMRRNKKDVGKVARKSCGIINSLHRNSVRNHYLVIINISDIFKQRIVQVRKNEFKEATLIFL